MRIRISKFWEGSSARTFCAEKVIPQHNAMASVYKSLSKKSGEKDDAPATGIKKNKQRVLILSSRGITSRQRHLMNDLASLLPHSRKDAKLDTKSKLYQLNELAELYNTNNIMFFESRKNRDLYLWMSKPPNGPTIKMHVQNLHTMEELHFTGNCLKGSRPVLSFDAQFDSEPHLRLLKELFLHMFGVPKGARKAKPFVDHVMGFTLADGKVWIRNYQINETEKSVTESAKKEKGKDTEVSLVEIGPRFVLTPIVIQEGSFGGPILYQNKEFVSPNQVRSEIRIKKAGRYNARAEQGVDRLAKRGDLGLRTTGGRKMPKDALDTSQLFA
ncbi:ribosome biogenesis protein BRX1 [Phlyctema vagabunda]|uniref:Ribosome biogenesis protein BRX1 n=1 Tax=Phlyctema vagabunda TaxID=108571 RepID=A0ABR4PD82_9HELO